MITEPSVFEKTYRDYLAQLRQIDLASSAAELGAAVEGNALKIPLFGNQHTVSADGISDPMGKRPSHDICVILSKYVLLCPHGRLENNQWVSFRDFKDSGPLITYFAHDVERGIASFFSGRLNDLEKACAALKGSPPRLEATYDLSRRFEALPRLPIILLYNDADEEFPAKCAILFEARAERYLDAECLAMVGWQLFGRLKKALK
jgi:hypothetical protein